MFERENAFYAAHKDEFHKNHLNKWLVVVGDSLLGVFDTTKEAFETAVQRYAPGEFMMRKPADDDTVLDIGPFVSMHHTDIDQERNPSSALAIADGGLMAFPYV